MDLKSGNILALLLAFGLVPIYCRGQTEVDWTLQAETMVREQLISRGISNSRVLLAMKKTPRQLFIPETVRPFAYEDGALPIGYKQTISQPYIVALMTELLELKGSEKVLEIGTGSGYQAAILSHLVDTCYTIEIVEPLAEQAKTTLSSLGYGNVVVKWGDGYKGWPQHAPFEKIIITAAPEEIPKALIEQLAEGGTMVLPVGDKYQELVVVTKTKKKINKRTIIPVRFVPMVHPKAPIPDEY